MPKIAYFCERCKKKIKRTEDEYEHDPWKDF